MSPRSPPNPLTDTVPFFFQGLGEVEFRALRNGEADSGSSPLLSLLESSGVAARAGTSPPTKACGPLAGPVAGVRWGGVTWKQPCRALGATYITQKCDWAQRE